VRLFGDDPELPERTAESLERLFTGLPDDDAQLVTGRAVRREDAGRPSRGLVLDERPLEEAIRLSGERTRSGVVQRTSVGTSVWTGWRGRPAVDSGAKWGVGSLGSV